MKHPLLTELRACRDAVDYCEGFKSLEDAWQKCERADWMLWFAGRRKVERKVLVSIACECARLALPYTKDPRVLACIETTEAWVCGEVTLETVIKHHASAGAYAAHAAYADAAAAAAYAAHAAYAAADAADAAYAAHAAAHAAYAAADAADAAADAAHAAYAAADAADAAVRLSVRKKCADIVRKHIPSLP